MKKKTVKLKTPLGEGEAVLRVGLVPHETYWEISLPLNEYKFQGTKSQMLSYVLRMVRTDDDGVKPEDMEVQDGES